MDLKEPAPECDSICMAAAVPDLQDLQERAFEAHRRALTRTRVVTHAARTAPSAMPILYFGDPEAYVASPVRIVTVGLNPSQAEFPLGPLPGEPNLTDDPWQRFPGAAGCSAPGPDYLLALNAYFHIKPYRWFDNFSPLLAGMQATYHSCGPASTALQTDLCTPVPTTPTWSDLDQEDRVLLGAHGYSLWWALMARLRPDVVVVSVAADHLVAAGLGDPTRWATAMTITAKKDGTPRKRAYHIRMSRQVLGEGSPLFVWGQAAETPFGTVSYPDRKRIGVKVLELWQTNALLGTAA